MIPYQVSWDGIKDRHKKAIDEFKKAYPKAEDPVFLIQENIESFLK